MRKTLVIVGVICLCLVFAFLGGFGLYLLMNRGVKTPTQNPVLISEVVSNVRDVSSPQNVTNAPFANIPESDIPGRYKYISGDKDYFIILYDDHSFKNKDGTILSVHRWDLTPEGLVLQWKTSSSLYNHIEAPGIYTGPKEDGTTRRLEKQSSTDPAELIKPTTLTRTPVMTAKPEGDVIAFIRFDSPGETNSLIPVNTGNGDGKFILATIEGVACAQLERKPGRPEAYLYLRIAPELKNPPFTNAMVVVEYFDTTGQDINSSLLVQYDSPKSTYLQTPKRVPLTGRATWKEAWFVLNEPAFENRQNAQADFRLCVMNPELFVRSVKLVRNPLPPSN